MTWKNTFANNRWTDGFGATAGRSRPHRGTDLAVWTIYAWERLTVVSNPFYAALGNCVLLRAADGELFGVAHCRKGTRPDVGDVLEPGDKIADAASGPWTLPYSNPEFPGTEWRGVHFHITRTGPGGDPFGAAGLKDAKPRIIDRVRGAKPSTPIEEEEDEMKNSGFYYTRKDGFIVYLIANFGSGAYHEYGSGVKGKGMNGSYNNPIAATLGTGSFAQITESHANVIKKSLDALRRTAVSGSVTAIVEDDA